MSDSKISEEPQNELPPEPSEKVEAPAARDSSSEASSPKPNKQQQRSVEESEFDFAGKSEASPSPKPEAKEAAKPEDQKGDSPSEGERENSDPDGEPRRKRRSRSSRKSGQRRDQKGRRSSRDGENSGHDRDGKRSEQLDLDSGEDSEVSSDSEEGGEERPRKTRKQRYLERKEKERAKEAAALEAAPEIESEGLVEISPKGFGFLRETVRGFQQSPTDVFITPEVVRNFNLRDGLMVKCTSKQGLRGPQLTKLLTINGKEPLEYQNLPYFEELTAINPDKKLTMETVPTRVTTRVIDLMAPIGRGQRGLIVAPPRTGKTTLLHHIAEGLLENYEDEMHLMVLLVDERPEEVTDFERSFPNVEVFSSSNDSDGKDHTRIALLAIERAKRLVEAGEHVFILMDSITRLARAFNSQMRGGGKRGTASGGLLVGALEVPRRIFAAARNTREAGSLTIIATALIQTNSKADEAIFQEFKGTGNMELVLDRQIAQNYIYPAVDIHKSGTRREELLLPPHMLEKIYVIRRGLGGYKPLDAMEWLLRCMERYPSNAQMLMDIKTTALS